MIDYEGLILERQDLQEIYEDDPDSSYAQMVNVGGMISLMKYLRKWRCK